jgi:aerobic carbon-monoxide dehydrogenase small subunit
MTAEKLPIEVTVNGRMFKREVEPRVLLCDFLRYELRLTGTHVGCAHGVCGACTVSIDGNTARSCVTLAVQADGANIETVEALASGRELSVIQQAFYEHHALQCGFCTPGFLMTARELLARDPEPSEQTIRRALSGNICRCTGYVHIVRAIQAAARRLAERRLE